MSNIKKFKCPKCGSQDFSVTESIVHSAMWDVDTNQINAFKVTNNFIDEVMCKKCSSSVLQEILEEKINIIFN